MNGWNFKDKNNFVFIGEAGSGKTENALNFAIRCMEEEGKQRVFFDMDQTKGVFRSRDCEDILKTHDIKFMETTTFMDAPILPAGVIGALSNESSINIFDLGGNEIGARTMGQFSHKLNNKKTKVFYVVNPYRPFSYSGKELIGRMNDILTSSSLYDADVTIISNPCLGKEITAEEILGGHSWLKNELMNFHYYPEFISVNENLVSEIEGKVEDKILPLKIYIQYP